VLVLPSRSQRRIGVVLAASSIAIVVMGLSAFSPSAWTTSEQASVAAAVRQVARLPSSPV
jgi:hypothetical protein